MNSFKPHLSDESYENAMATLSTGEVEQIKVDYAGKRIMPLPSFPDNVVALLHFGRSGTGLLHSLLDGHPEISTLPSIYLRGFFSAKIWSKLAGKGWEKLAEQFSDEFAVLFDATSTKSTPGLFEEDSSLLGVQEGMTSVGENRNEALSLDRTQFCTKALQLVSQFPEIDPKIFFLIIHAAYEEVMGTKTDKHTIFYHLHSPDKYATLNFLRYLPDARFIMMIREPIQCCESWIRRAFIANNYNRVCRGIIQMLFSIDQVIFRKHTSIGVRLEDLKANPEATLRSLCQWLGIEETPSLYQMTAQGKKWWGDPTSPDYEEKKDVSPFDKTSTRRRVGTIFSKKDQFILRTLFYPLSVRFGYQFADPAQFEKDLKEIKPMCMDILDYEKLMIERGDIDPLEFKKSHGYLLLRAAFADRWEVLNEFKDYPHMLTPLPVSHH